MVKYFPIMLDLQDRRVVVIGGGAVAERKAGALLEAGAAVVLVSPSLTGTLAALAEAGRLCWVSRRYAPGDLEGAFLVYAASNEAAVNEAVAQEARSLGLPVNVAGRAEAGSFITPGVLRRGRLTVAVSTSGAGPSAAARITEQLAGILGEEYEPYLDWLHGMRAEIKRRELPPELRGRLLRSLGEADVLNRMRQGTFIEWSAEEIDDWIARNLER
ncbi:bifunctional precorrin-2 dehydrogenase/sirohydrochlorin ferrochelatase [Paenibacillus sp. S150]|uniref:precorrin-2 dehydrogenase/sirohydrochlorin ferrochelatase family protein n=1 Tax=Paenibacillus sp. S150 TaxID=2749826 RepID=UPI001C586CEE|nr:NAD(P)-dependent oxidoreductase [Paenibacillus sp. S150]MBW4084742.1 bifunctional precorrin-2 dehydrogenase/sirohydrochlorin ferrochelatase [Paenibacillus sp. S150]